jgi:hypothetical protein
MIQLSSNPPYLLNERIDDIEEVIDLLLQRAISISRTQPLKSSLLASNASFTSIDYVGVDMDKNSRMSYGSSVLPSTEDLYPIISSPNIASPPKRLGMKGFNLQNRSLSNIQSSDVQGRKQSLTKDLAERLEVQRRSSNIAVSSVSKETPKDNLRRASMNQGSKTVSILPLQAADSRKDDQHVHAVESKEVNQQDDRKEASQKTLPFSNSTLRSLFGSI